MNITSSNLRTITSKRNIMKAMVVVIAIALFAVSTSVVAFAGGASEGVKAIYDYIVDITKVAGALLALFGIIQIGVSIAQTHDASQRMTGILLAAGGAMLFFATDILNLMGIQP